MELPHMINESEAAYQGRIFIAVDEHDAGIDKYTAACDVCAFRTMNCINIQCDRFSGRSDGLKVIFK